jgi:hypothetical protein
MDDMFCVTPGVGLACICGCTWSWSWKHEKILPRVTTIWQKLNGSQATICRRFEHWYRHMALVGNKTIEELILFYFHKEIILDFTILW